MLSDKEMLKITKGLLEIAENNKDKAFEEFKKELEKEESKAVDELVSFTHNHAEEK